MAYEEDLKQAGLTGNEAKVYLELLRRGSLSANNLAKRLGMDRTLSYTVLNHLIEKGLATYIIKDKKKYFDASDPVNLRNNIKKQESYVEDLIPRLKGLEKIKEHPQEITVYEGKDGLRAMFNLLEETTGEILSFGATGRAYEALYEAPRMVNDLRKKGLKGRIVGNAKYRGQFKFVNKDLKVRYLAVKSESTTTILGDYVAIHILTQKPTIILIKNKEIAEGYRNYFDVIWTAAKP